MRYAVSLKRSFLAMLSLMYLHYNASHPLAARQLRS
jgi:hypothetical protein